MKFLWKLNLVKFYWYQDPDFINKGADILSFKPNLHYKDKDYGHGTCKEYKKYHNFK